jgi:nucleotide-binding universal stress UspA family protein
MIEPLDERGTLLVDIELPDPAPIPPRLAALMGSLKVILVGWYAVPEQTSPAQARDQLEGELQVMLDAVAKTLRSAGAEVETHLVFTGNEFATIERISAETDCDAVLIPKPATALERVLVPVRGLQNASRIAHFVADLVQDGTTDVTLLHVLKESEEDGDSPNNVLTETARLAADAGIDAGLIRLRTEHAGDPAEAIIDAAKDHDTMVIGETEPSVRGAIFGSVGEQVARDATVPVMVVRRRSGEYD